MVLSLIGHELIDLECIWASHTESPLDSGNSRVLLPFSFLKRRSMEGYTDDGLQEMIVLVCIVVLDILGILSFLYPKLLCLKAVYYFKLPPRNE